MKYENRERDETDLLLTGVSIDRPFFLFLDVLRLYS